MGGLSFDEMQTGIIFGFLNSLLSIQKRFNALAIVFTWDSRKSKREKIYAGYKEKRKKKADKSDEDIILDSIAYSQFSTLRRKVLPEMGFKNNFICTGLEADDIMAKIAFDDSFLFCPECDTVVVTRDNDMLQIISERVSLYDPQTKKLKTLKWFRDKYDIEPSQWAEVKAIGGCSTDEVPGVKGVAEGYAIQYIKGTLSEKGVLYKRIVSRPKLIARNRQLVKLPFVGTTIPDIQTGVGINFFNFDIICQKYGFLSFLKAKRYKEWYDAFGAI